LLINALTELGKKEGLDLNFRAYDWVTKIIKVQKPVVAQVQAAPPEPHNDLPDGASEVKEGNPKAEEVKDQDEP
jgi:hypothetical protein